MMEKSTEYPPYSDFLPKTVKDLPEDEQPREKMLRYGAESLSDAELIAILLRTGIRKLNVIDTSRAMINHFGGLSQLCRRKWEELKVIPGVAKVKAITLEAAFELARRIEVADLGNQIRLSSPQEVSRFFSPKIRTLEKEVFIIAFLNNSKNMMSYKKISMGGKTSTIVDVSEVMREAILQHAMCIVVVHNHPSGRCKPSSNDIRLTKRIQKAGEIMGIKLLDHIIVAGNDFYSLNSNGDM